MLGGMVAFTVLPESMADRGAIDALLLVAFPGPGEAALVLALREAGDLLTSLVALVDDAVVGHVAWSPITVDGAQRRASGLGPVAVAPSHRRRGIAEALIRAGLEARRAAGDELAVVLGDPAYYARFGFRPASTFGLRDDYAGGDAFQAMELRPGGAPPGGGEVRYAPAFALASEDPPGAPPREQLGLIVARAENGAIGLAGGLPWDLPDDRAHFERTTRGHAVILGRRTWEETGAPLAGRRTVVVSRGTAGLAGATVVGSLDEALVVARAMDPMPFVIGGRRLFEEALPRATRVYLTEIPGAPQADVFLALDRRGLTETASWRGTRHERYVVLAPRGGDDARG